MALVLSILFPDIGNWWYALTLVSPLSAVYYFQRGERAEEVRPVAITAATPSLAGCHVPAGCMRWRHACNGASLLDRWNESTPGDLRCAFAGARQDGDER